MAAPAYTWEFVYDLWGDRVPKVVTLEATTNLETKIGTLLFMTGGQVDNCTDGTGSMIGLAKAATSAAATAADPIEVELIAPGMVIRGTATADISGQTGFASRIQDIDSDQRADEGDVTGGFLSVYRVVPGTSGLTVDCIVTNFDMGQAV